MRLDCENWPGWPDKRPAIIAEVGMNHGGNKNLAWEMIQAAHENGADFVKLQTYSTERFFHPSLSYFNSTKSMELSPESTAELFANSEKKGIQLFTTPFDSESVDFIEGFDPKLYKIASMDNDNTPLIQHIAKKNRPVIVSCGMANLEEISQALKTMKEAGNECLILLHCVSDYPAKPDSLNLEMIPYLKKQLNVPVGFSDHAIGLHSAYMAISMGAAIIEKHFTTDRKLSGQMPDADHEISIEPKELNEMRAFCEAVPLMRGKAPRQITSGEEEGRTTFRRGLYTSKPVRAGEKISLKNTVLLRPVKGVAANQWLEVCGKPFLREMGSMEAINLSDLKP
jgi:N,N'-diacetyllegionaminate synthase